MRVAIVDCGTNTVRLLIADVLADELREVTRDARLTRLGQGVDATGVFHADALARTFAVVDDYARTIAASQVDKVRFVATSAARDVGNREEFFAGVRDRLGVTPEVISGAEEAKLSFLGALSGGPLEPEGTVLVMDIGGGSTELIRGSVAAQESEVRGCVPDHESYPVVHQATSLDVGAVRLRERYLRHDPPSDDEVSLARQAVARMLDESPVDLGGITHFIGVAGTCTSLSAMNLGLRVYDAALVHNSCLELGVIDAFCDQLLHLTADETNRIYPILQPLRAEVIAAGTLICAEVAHRVARPMLVRETDILNGAARQLVRT